MLSVQLQQEEQHKSLAIYSDNYKYDI